MVQIKGTALQDSAQEMKQKFGAEHYNLFINSLPEEAKEVFTNIIIPTKWYPLDHFVSFLEQDIKEFAGGDETSLIEKTEKIIEKQLGGIYSIFVRLAKPELIIKRIGAVHSTYFKGVEIQILKNEPGHAELKYLGFEKQHRLIEYVIIGFYKKALEICGASSIEAKFVTSIGEDKGYSQLSISWVI